jgi:membrane-bound serine protease (ClpP class)
LNAKSSTLEVAMERKTPAPLTGKIGVTDSALQPTGTILIDNEIYTVESDAGFVEEGRGVLVTRVKGKKIYVRRV